MTATAECELVELLIAAGDQADAAARAMIDDHVAHCGACREIAMLAGSFPPGDPSAYALGAEVARGGMGRIRSAQDLRFGRTVAVKELVGATPKLLARFEREARITACLQHPGIVPIYDIGRWPDGTPYYAMRMVAGTTLKAKLAGAALGERLELVPAVISATEAVAFAHGSDVIHRDLTPTNILVGDYGETVVIDWGLAKDISRHDDDDDDVVDIGPYREHASPDLTARGSVIGTAAYMPPEQAAGHAVDARADVYALGAILFEVLAGEPPYRAGTADEVLAQVRGGPPRPLRELVPELPVDLTSIVAKAMARDPADRYPSAKSLAEDLRRFQAGQLVGARQYSMRQLLLRWLWRHRAIVAITGIALAIVLVLVVTGVRALLVEQRRTEQQRVAAEDLVTFMLGDITTSVDHNVAEKIGKRVISFYRARGVSPKLAAALEQLAEVHLRLKDTNAAIDDRRDAAAVRQQLAASDRETSTIESYLETRDKLGLLLRGAGRTAESIVEFELAVFDAERFYAADRSRELRRRAAWARDRLSIALLESGDVDRASLHHARAAELAGDALSDHPEKIDWYFAIDMHFEYGRRMLALQPVTGAAELKLVSDLTGSLTSAYPELLEKLGSVDGMRELVLEYRALRHEIHDPVVSRTQLEISAEVHESVGRDKCQASDTDGGRVELLEAIHAQTQVVAAQPDIETRRAAEAELRRMDGELSACVPR